MPSFASTHIIYTYERNLQIFDYEWSKLKNCKTNMIPLYNSINEL